MAIPALPQQAQLPPDLAGQIAQLQMRQQLSQALLGQSMQPTNPTRTAGKYVVPISPLEGLSKMATTALLSKGMADTNKSEMNLYAQANQRRNDALSNALMQGSGGGLPPGLQAPQQTDPNGAPGFNVVPGQPSNISQSSVPGGRETLRDIYAEAAKLAPAYGTDMLTILGSPLYEARIKAAQQDAQRTDLQKNMGDPSLADWRKKETFIPPTVLRPNSLALDSDNKIFLNNAEAPQGTFNTFQPGNPNPTGNQPIAGAAQNIQTMRQAEATGTEAGKGPYQMEMVMVDGKMQPRFKSQLPGYPGSTPTPPPGPALPAQVSQQSTVQPALPAAAPQQARPAPQLPNAMQIPPYTATPQANALESPPYASTSVPSVGRPMPQQAVSATPLAAPAKQPSGAAPNIMVDPWKTMPKIAPITGFGMTPYQEATAKNTATIAQGLVEQHSKAAMEAAQRKATNDQALSLVDKSDTGFGAAKLAEVKNVLIKIVPGLTEASFENTPTATKVLDKDLFNSAVVKARQVFNNPRMTQMEVMQYLQRGAPGVDMPKAAIKFLLTTDNLQADYAIQQSNDLGKYLQNNGDPNRFHAWYESQFPLTKKLSSMELGTPKGTAATPGPQFTREEIDAEMKRRGLK